MSKSYMSFQEKLKHLQNLYSWYELYNRAQRKVEAESVQQEITEWKAKYNLR